MSDFDREAERERLREKYERDKAKREASERMSELLLQGATMTNRHCPECHSPVFRYDGREFCPTCQREVSEDGAGADDGAEGTQATDGVDAVQETDGAASDAAETGDATADGSANADPDPDPEADTAETSPAPLEDRRPARIDPPVSHPGDASDGDRTGASTDGEGLNAAQVALVREIADLTRRAEATGDVGRKREFFSAAREAAETLRAIRQL